MNEFVETLLDLPWQVGDPKPAYDVVIIGAAHRSGGVPRGKSNVKGYVRAFDVRTGETLWSTRLGTSLSGSPVSFSIGGRQYIAVPAGGIRYAQLKGNAILIFALPSTGR